MSVSRAACKLYAVTDRRWLGDHRLIDHVATAIENGVTFVQLREKNEDAFVRDEVEAIGRLCRVHHVPFVINDRVDWAKAVGADGVHVGQDDTPLVDVRRQLGHEAIVGVSVHTVAEAQKAERDGADYLGVGAVVATATKREAEVMTRDEIRAICAAVSIPVVAIGGVSVETIASLHGLRLAGVAVVSALFGASDVALAARRLASAVDDMVRADG